MAIYTDLQLLNLSHVAYITPGTASEAKKTNEAAFWTANSKETPV